MPNKQKCPICDNKRVDICCVLWYEANQKPKKTKKIKKQSGVIEMPNEEIVCPACKKLVILRTELPSNKKWYECYRCGLAGPFGETKEAAIANFRAIRIDRTVG